MSSGVDDLYRKVPALHCKGLCEASCGIILLQESEYQAIVNRRPDFPTVTVAETLTCPLLENGRCSVHDVRPLICRLWGAVKMRSFRCPHGCRPKRWLSDAEGHALINEAIRREPLRSLHADVDDHLRKGLPHNDIREQISVQRAKRRSR